jgi:hypothetical protein
MAPEYSILNCLGMKPFLPALPSLVNYPFNSVKMCGTDPFTLAKVKMRKNRFLQAEANLDEPTPASHS